MFVSFSLSLFFHLISCLERSVLLIVDWLVIALWFFFLLILCAISIFVFALSCFVVVDSLMFFLPNSTTTLKNHHVSNFGQIFSFYIFAQYYIRMMIIINIETAFKKTMFTFFFFVFRLSYNLLRIC